MKRIVLIFGLLVPFILEAQVGRFPYQIIRQTYQGDTLETTIGDTVKQYTNADAYSYNKPLVIRDTSLLELIEKHGGGGATLPGSLGEILLSDGAGGAATNTSIKWDASESGLFVSDLSTDTAYLRHDGITVNDGRQSTQFALGFHPTVGYYYQSILRSSTDLANLNRSQFRTYANSKSNRAYIEVERNPSYLTQVVLDSAGMYLLGDFDTTKWVDNNFITKRWVLDRVSSGSSGGSAVGDVGDVQFSNGENVFTNSGGVSTGSAFNWDGSHLSINSNNGYSYFEVDMGDLSSGFIDFFMSDGSDEFGLYQDYGGFEVYGTGTSEYSFKVNSMGISTKQLSGSLTDGAPTVSEITAILGTSASSVDAGFQVTIKDTDGSGLLYQVESDGANWFYTVMSQAL